MSRLYIVAGAGPGIGHATAARFHREGYTVGLLARTKDKLDDLVEDLGERAFAVPVDLSDLDRTREVFEHIAEEHGVPSVFHHNASLFRPTPALELEPSVLHADLALSMTSALLGAQVFAPKMEAAGGGTLLFTGGGLALSPEIGDASPALTVSKCALRGLVLSMVKEMRRHQVAVRMVTVAGNVAPDTPFAPTAIAEALYAEAALPFEEERAETVFDGT